MRAIFSKSSKDDKKMTAEFYDKDKKVKTTHFGSANGSSFIDHKDEKKKDAWIARHKVRGNFNDPTSASSLSKHILWNKKSVKESIADYKSKFNLS